MMFRFGGFHGRQSQRIAAKTRKRESAKGAREKAPSPSLGSLSSPHFGSDFAFSLLRVFAFSIGRRSLYQAIPTERALQRVVVLGRN